MIKESESSVVNFQRPLGHTQQPETPVPGDTEAVKQSHTS